MLVLLIVMFVAGVAGMTVLLVSAWYNEEDVCWQPTPGEWVGHICRVYPNRKDGQCKICGRHE